MSLKTLPSWNINEFLVLSLNRLQFLLIFSKIRKEFHFRWNADFKYILISNRFLEFFIHFKINIKVTDLSNFFVVFLDSMLRAIQ